MLRKLWRTINDNSTRILKSKDATRARARAIVTIRFLTHPLLLQ